MGAVNKDICVRTFTFSVIIVKLCQSIDQKSQTGQIIAKQLLRSGTSIGANVEEAQAAQSKADFINKMTISLKEARETNYWLRLLVATEIVPKERTGQIQTEAVELMRIIGAIIVRTKQNN
ncbi:MAG TPA: four helix bundle protein [Kamptonema sp.]|nr:four helix bundle protein [Kamptonema sp.]